jgi:hypothetical protein
MATNQNGKSPNGLLLKIQSALAGVQQMPASDGPLRINGQTMTQAQLITQLSGYLPAFTAAANAKTSHAQAVQARRATESDARTFLQQLRRALVANYQVGSPALASFGMSAKLPATQSNQTRILADAKRTLTRQKRGTMGKKQKAGIKAVGTPQVSVGATGVQITPAAGDQPAVTPASSSSTPVTPGATGTPAAK